MSMYAEERQQAIAELVAQNGRLSVTDLAERYEVTTETVRRDLSALERLGLVRRVHGGAVPSDTLTVIESALGERDAANTAEKDRIARAALDFLPPNGGTVLLDAGSTTSRLAALLPRDRRLTVVTHAVPIAARLAGLPHIDLHLLPGRVRTTTHAAVGIETVRALADLRADVAFVGTNGITVEHGLTTPDRDEAATKRAMVASARQVVVLADATKVGESQHCVSPRSTTSTSWSPTVASRTGTASPSSAPDSRWSPHDRHTHPQSQPRPHRDARRPAPARRRPARGVGDLAGRRQGRQHLPRLGGRGHPLDRGAAGPQGRPVRPRAAGGGNRLSPGPARG